MTSSRALVLGANGQVGHALRMIDTGGDITITALSRAEADLTRPETVIGAVEAFDGDLVINAAAHTAVDRAESEPDLAHAINHHGVATLARACAATGKALIHLSTDYVFDGHKTTAYTEDDPIAPLGVYGASKAAGELAVRAALDRHVILRTSWVFGVHGGNFVKTMLRLGAERDQLRVVDDQRGGPTAAHDIAATLITIARRIRAGNATWGTFHLAGAPIVSWRDFAIAIFAERQRLTGRPPPAIAAITTADFPTPARRPMNSALDGGRLREMYGVAPPDWRQELPRVVRAALD